MRTTRVMVAILACGAATCFSAAAPQAASLADFYTGKQVRIVVGYGPGNAYDAAARLVGRHMSNHIPGHPTMIVQNMPGAGTRKAADWLYNVAPKDGTAMGMFSQNIPMDQVLDKKKIRFDVRKFNWIGNTGRKNNVLFVWHATGVKTMADAAKKPLVIGAGAGGNTPAVIYPLVAAKFLGAQFKVISGYRSQEAFLAVERGEVAGLGARSWGSIEREKPDWIKGNKINVLFQTGLAKDPGLPQVPLFSDLAKNDDQRQVMEFVSGTIEMGRPFAAPPGVPADKVAALRTAFNATTADPKLLADAQRSQLIVNPMRGEDLDALVKKIIGVSPRAVALLKDALKVKPTKRKKAKKK